MRFKYFISTLLNLFVLIATDHAQVFSKDSTLPVINNYTSSQIKPGILLENNPNKKPSFIYPYNNRFKKDWLVVVSALGVGALGYTLISHKHDLTLDQLHNKNKDNVVFFDRWSAGHYSKKADRQSYPIFYASYLYPVLGMLLNRNIHSRIKEISLLFIETISISSAMYTLADGLIYRSRPYVYGTNAPEDLRMKKRSQRSFYSGHVSTVAAASFFMARVHKDMGGHKKLQPWLWGIAATLPAVMSYERIKAGYHFLSDCAFSYAIGAATGLLIPAMHKTKKHLQKVLL